MSKSGLIPTISDADELVFLKNWLEKSVQEERYELAQIIKNRMIELKQKLHSRSDLENCLLKMYRMVYSKM